MKSVRKVSELLN